MRKIIVLLLFSFIVFTCNRNHELTRDEVEVKLKQAMHDFLIKGKDTNVVKYDVVKVIYYSAPKVYYCDFHVHMKAYNVDTVGEMKAYIQKDFSKVTRTY